MWTMITGLFGTILNVVGLSRDRFTTKTVVTGVGLLVLVVGVTGAALYISHLREKVATLTTERDAAVQQVARLHSHIQLLGSAVNRLAAEEAALTKRFTVVRKEVIRVPDSKACSTSAPVRTALDGLRKQRAASGRAERPRGAPAVPRQAGHS